jgi:hypothetical protein
MAEVDMMALLEAPYERKDAPKVWLDDNRIVLCFYIFSSTGIFLSKIVKWQMQHNLPFRPIGW